MFNFDTFNDFLYGSNFLGLIVFLDPASSSVNCLVWDRSRTGTVNCLVWHSSRTGTENLFSLAQEKDGYRELVEQEQDGNIENYDKLGRSTGSIPTQPEEGPGEGFKCRSELVKSSKERGTYSQQASETRNCGDSRRTEYQGNFIIYTLYLKGVTGYVWQLN